MAPLHGSAAAILNSLPSHSNTNSGELFKLDGWKYIQGNAQAGTLHLIGLLSDGGVHSRWVGNASQ